MVYTQELILSWFKELHGYNRIGVMCNLLNMCLPFELRFLGTCIENLGKKDYLDLRDAENKANNSTELESLSNINEERTRQKLILYVSLMKTTNHVCSNVIFKLLSNGDSMNSIMSQPIDVNILDELLLLYTLAANHPAFTFEQRTHISDILIRLIDMERNISCTKFIQCQPVPGFPIDLASKIAVKPYPFIPHLSSSLHQCGSCQCPVSFIQNEVTQVNSSLRHVYPYSQISSSCSQAKDTVLSNAEVESCSSNGQDIMYKLTLYWEDGSVRKLLVSIANLCDLHQKLMQHPSLKVLPNSVKLPQFPVRESIAVPVIKVREYLMQLLTQSAVVSLPPVAEFLNLYCKDDSESSQNSSGNDGPHRSNPISDNVKGSGFKPNVLNGHYPFKMKIDANSSSDNLSNEMNAAKLGTETHGCDSSVVTVSPINSPSDPTLSCNSFHCHPVLNTSGGASNINNCSSTLQCTAPLVKGANYISKTSSTKAHISDSISNNICCNKNLALPLQSACLPTVGAIVQCDNGYYNMTEPVTAVSNSGPCVTTNNSPVNQIVSIADTSSCNLLSSSKNCSSDKPASTFDQISKIVPKDHDKEELFELMKQDRLDRYCCKLSHYSVQELKLMSGEELRKLSLPNPVVTKLRKILNEIPSSSSLSYTMNGLASNNSQCLNGVVTKPQIYTVSELTTVPNPKATLSIQPLPNPLSQPIPPQKSFCFRNAAAMSPCGPIPSISFGAVNTFKYPVTVHQGPMTMTNHTPITTVAPSQSVRLHRRDIDIISPSKPHCNSCPEDSPSCSEGSSPPASPTPERVGESDSAITPAKLYSSLRILDAGNCDSNICSSVMTSPHHPHPYNNIRTQTGYYVYRSSNPPTLIRDGVYRNRPMKPENHNGECVITCSPSPVVTSNNCIQSATGSRENSPSTTPPSTFNQSASVITGHYNPIAGFHGYPGFMSPPPNYYPLNNSMTPEVVFGSQFQLIQPHSSSQSYIRQFPGNYISVPSIYVQNSNLTNGGKGKTPSCYNCGQTGHRGNDCLEATIEDITRAGQYRLDYTPVPKQKS